MNEAEIAIIGMSCRFPGAQDINTFWQNLRDGVESVSFFSDEELLSSGVDPTLLNNPSYVKARGILKDIDLFDAPFFGFSPGEAEMMDPQHRLFLEEAWKALEHAGYNPNIYDDLIGVYAGVGVNTYLLNNLYPHLDFSKTAAGYQLMIGNNHNFLTTRVSYKLNLKGPSVNVQTACSTSLVAVHLACQSLLHGECDMALAGGVTIYVPQKTGYVYQEGMILSPDGHCRAFDAQGQGIVSGNGVGIVVLKRLPDAIDNGDCIHAIIKGTAVNNDGSGKIGYTAPSVDGQAAVISEAQAIAGVDAETITYIETHGTGTALGDPIEIRALTQAFRESTQKKGFCTIGSVKTNFGHLDAAAGVASLIKTVLALKHKRIPPSLHFEHPNPKIDFKNSPFYVNTTLSEWKPVLDSDRGIAEIPCRAGVSSFGIGGTNAHIVLEEFNSQKLQVESQKSKSRPEQLLVLSAKTESALEKTTANLAEYLKQHSDINLADVAYTLQVGRTAFEHRRILVCQNIEEAVNLLNSLDSKQVLTHVHESGARPVAFMFPGQGAQYVNMGLELYRAEPTFCKQVDRCSELLKPLIGLDLRHILYPGSAGVSSAKDAGETPALPGGLPGLEQTAITQPAIFVIEYALAQLWMEWGISPQAMIGHSIGEYVAACLAGVFSLEDALTLAATRGKFMQSLPTGTMLSVPLPEHEIQPLLGENLSLAAVNAPSLCVISGSTEAIEDLQNQLREKGTTCLRLHTSHAFHSKMMDPILEKFTEQVKQVTLNPPRIPWVSTVTGTWLTPEDVTTSDYWTRNLRKTVRFADGVRHVLQDPAQILLEIGPGRTLSTLVKRCLREKKHSPDPPQGKVVEQVTLSSLRHPQDKQSDEEFLLTTLGKLWLEGVRVDWSGFYTHETRCRLPLPVYPFERQRYWIEPPKKKPETQISNLKPQISKKPNIADWFYLPLWKQAPPLVFSQTFEVLKTSEICWLVFLDECGLGSRLVERLERDGQYVMTVKVGSTFTKLNNRKYMLDPQQSDDYDSLLNDLRTLEKSPTRVVHLWSVTENSHQTLDREQFDIAQNIGFYSLLFLAQALERQNITHELQLVVISNNMQEVIGGDLLCPEKAPILGPCKVIPQEYLNIRCRSIDIMLPENANVPPTHGGQTSLAFRKLIDQLLMELAIQTFDTIIAYRGNHRWVQIFEPVRLQEPDEKLPCLKEEGVYLITGGLGNIGFLLAEYLAKTTHAKLILTGRSALPARDEREQWLDSHDENDRISHKILKVRQLEELGAEVLVMSADIANTHQMQGAITQAEARFGRINGVIHAAGIAGEQAFREFKETNKSECEQQFQSKIYGLLVLEELFQERELDFCVLLSSLSSVLGGLGFTAYSAANLFMDAFVRQHNRKNLASWISANLDAWQVGKEKKLPASVGATLTELAMTSEEGISMFQRILSLNHADQIVVSTGNLQARIEQWIYLKSLPKRDRVKKGKKTSDAMPQTEAERLIAQVWQEMLQIDEIGIHENFFELGGHSLLAVQIYNNLKDQFGLEIALTDLFQYPTIHALAQYIHPEQSKQAVSQQSYVAESRSLRQASQKQRRQRRQQHRLTDESGE